MRTFIALELPEEIKEQLSRICSRLQAHNLRNINWVARENLHITLLFIGDINHVQQKEISRLISEMMTDMDAPVFCEPALKLMPQAKPHLLWMEYQAQTANLGYRQWQLRKQISEIVPGLDTKKLRYHVTLGRIKGQLTSLFIEEVLNLRIPSLNFKSSIITLYQSILRLQGPEYIALDNFLLN